MAVWKFRLLCACPIVAIAVYMSFACNRLSCRYAPVTEVSASTHPEIVGKNSERV